MNGDAPRHPSAGPSRVDAILETLRPPWMRRAACRGKAVEEFFPPKGHEAIRITAQTRLLCETCPVRASCLEWALSWPECKDAGIFGGLTPKERREVMRADPVERRPCVQDFLDDQAARQFYERPRAAPGGKG